MRKPKITTRLSTTILPVMASSKGLFVNSKVTTRKTANDGFPPLSGQHPCIFCSSTSWRLGMLGVYKERSIISGTIHEDSCLLLWCLLIQLLSTQFHIPATAVSTSPAKVDVTSAAPAQNSCPIMSPLDSK